MFKEWSDKTPGLHQIMKDKDFWDQVNYIKSVKVICKCAQQNDFDITKDVDKMYTTWIQIAPKYQRSDFDLIVTNKTT